MSKFKKQTKNKWKEALAGSLTSIRQSTLIHISWITVPSSLASCLALLWMLEILLILNKLWSWQLTLTAFSSLSHKLLKSLAIQIFLFHWKPRLFRLELTLERLITLLTVRLSTNHGTLKTQFQKNLPRESLWSWDPRLNRISSSLLEVQTPRRVKISCQSLISVFWLMLMSNSVSRKVLKISWREITIIAWKSSSEKEKRLLNNKELRSFWLVELRCLASFARENSWWLSIIKKKSFH